MATVIARSPVGRVIMADAKDKTIEIFDSDSTGDKSAKIFSKIKAASDRKKAYSQQMHDKLLEGKSA